MHGHACMYECVCMCVILLSHEYILLILGLLRIMFDLLFFKESKTRGKQIDKVKKVLSSNYNPAASDKAHIHMEDTEGHGNSTRLWKTWQICIGEHL